MATKTLKASWMLPAPTSMGAALDAIIVQMNLTFPIPSIAQQGAQITRAAMISMLNAWKAAFLAPTLILFTGNPAIGPSTDFSALAEPTGSWYAEKPVVLGNIHDGGGTNLYISAPSVQWDYSGTDPAVTVTGAALIDVGP